MQKILYIQPVIGGESNNNIWLYNSSEGRKAFWTGKWGAQNLMFAER